MENPRTSNNQSENDRARAAAEAERLTREERERFHRELGKMPEKNGLPYGVLREIARDIKNR